VAAGPTCTPQTRTLSLSEIDNEKSQQLPTMDIFPVLTDAKKKTSITRTSKMKNKGILESSVGAPQSLDILINDQCTSLYQGCSGNRRMNDLISEYRALFHSVATLDERSRIAETSLVKIMEGGGRFLREISKSDEGCILWEEISQDEASQRILCALQTQELDVVVNNPKTCTTNATPLSVPGELISEADIDPSHDNETSNTSDGRKRILDCPRVRSDDSRKKQKIQLQRTLPTQGCDAAVLSDHPILQNCDGEATMRSTTSTSLDSCLGADTSLGMEQASTAESAGSLQQIVDLLCDDIVHHLSRAVSVAERLAFLESLEGVSFLTTTNDTFSPRAEELSVDTTADPDLILRRVFDASPEYPSDGYSDMTMTAEEVHFGNSLHHRDFPQSRGSVEVSSLDEHQRSTTISLNQELLEAAMFLTQTLDTTDGNASAWNHSQATVQVLNTLLQAISKDHPRAAPF